MKSREWRSFTKIAGGMFSGEIYGLYDVFHMLDLEFEGKAPRRAGQAKVTRQTVEMTFRTCGFWDHSG